MRSSINIWIDEEPVSARVVEHADDVAITIAVGGLKVTIWASLTNAREVERLAETFAQFARVLRERNDA